MKILVAAQDTGAANALSPVLKELAGKSWAHVEVLAVSHAVGIFSKNEILAQTVPDWDSDLAKAEAWTRRFFEKFLPDLLLVGTAWGVSLDKWLLRWAEESQTASFAMIDHWCHYRERFMEPHTGVVRLPSRIGVMDPFALEQAVAAGLPSERLVVVGQPYLEGLVREAGQPELLKEARTLRMQWQAGKSSPLILFASEKYPENPGIPTSSFPKYTETEALEGLLQAVNRLQEKNSFRPTVVVKLHPKESIQSFEQGPLARAANIQVVAGVSAWPSILASDLVVGMTSMILLEAALIGKAAISYQPDVKNNSPFVGTQLGIISTAAEVDQLTQQIEQAQQHAFKAFPLETQPRKILESLSAGNAVSRINSLLLELTSEREAVS